MVSDTHLLPRQGCGEERRIAESLEGTKEEVLLQKSLLPLFWQSPEVSQPGSVSFSRDREEVRKDEGR